MTLTYRGCSGLPSWCTLTAGANGALSLSCTANTSNTSRSATVTVSYNNPLNASQPITASFSLSQQPLSYNITIPNNTLSVAAKGETKTLSLAYVDRTGTVGLTYKSCSGLPSGATVTAGSNGTFSVAFPSNTTSATRSGTATIYYTNPLNSSQPVSAAFSYSQQPLPYNITIPNNSLSVAAAGETKPLSLAYVDRTGTVGLTYQSCSGLPSGATVTAGSNGTFSVAFPSNTTSAIRSGTATIYYANPINSNQPVSATFTYSQQPLPYNITIPNNSLTVAPSGETKTLTLAYSQRPGTVGLTYLNATGVPAWCTLTPNSGGTLSAACTANSGNTARSATITVSYVNPLNSAQPVTASFSLSQQPQSYAIRASSSSYSITSGGGSTTVSIVYTERSGSMDLEYINCSGVPAWCTISAGSGGHLTISAERNISGQNRYANLSVNYANPLNSAQPVTASFSVSQESMSSWITVTPKSVEVAGDGGTKIFRSGIFHRFYVHVPVSGLQRRSGAGPFRTDRRRQPAGRRIREKSGQHGRFRKDHLQFPRPGQLLRDAFRCRGIYPAAGRVPHPFPTRRSHTCFRWRNAESERDFRRPARNYDFVLQGVLSARRLGCNPRSERSIDFAYGSNGFTSLGSGNITVYYENPLDGNNPVSATISYTQQPDNYAVSFSSSQASVPTSGGSAEIGLAYTYRTDALSP
ncbi:MAG: BACON domain-containing protein [Alistipes indistinctus]